MVKKYQASETEGMPRMDSMSIFPLLLVLHYFFGQRILRLNIYGLIILYCFKNNDALPLGQTFRHNCGKVFGIFWRG